jgi:peptidoglycan/LPS O-acetylase OafA/YrhL
MSQQGIKNRLNRIYNLDSTARLKSFEGLRAWAVIMVFNVHFFGQYYKQHYFVQSGSFAEGVMKFLHSGHIGVDLFFVLSGFLIFTTLHRNKPDFRSYIGHRCSRILPAHVAVLFVILFPNIPWRSFLGNILFFPAFFSSHNMFNPVTWTLGWEWLFYVSMFFIFRFKGDDNRRMYVGIAGILYILLLITLEFGEASRWGESIGNLIIPEPGRFAGFFMGVIVAHLLTIDKIFVRFQRICSFLLPIAVIGVLMSQVVWALFLGYIAKSYAFAFLNLYYLAVSACFSVIVAFLAMNSSGGSMNFLLQSTFMRIVGQISFSFYLVHFAIALPLSTQIVINVDSFTSMCTHYICAFLLTIILASLLYYYFERPYFVSKKKQSVHVAA